MTLSRFVIPENPSFGKRISGAPIQLSLVIPTYNERRNIETMIRKTSLCLDSFIQNQYEIIIVDDNSPDGTWKAARGLMKQFPNLRVYRRLSGRGLATAVLRGWQRSRGKILGVIDGDLQHPPRAIPRLLRKMRAARADLVVATRYASHGGVGSWNPLRVWISKAATGLARLLLPEIAGKVTDPMSGLFLVRREALAGCVFNPTGYKLLLEILAAGNIRKIAEIGYVFDARRNDKSKVTPIVFLQYLVHLARLRFRAQRSG